MKLKRYLTEGKFEDNIETLKKDCMPYLKESKLWHKRTIMGVGRGESIAKGNLLKMKPRKNRIPTDTPAPLHFALDKWFKKKFGWNVRSEGVFTSPFPTLFQHTPIFFPIGPFKYVYSNEVQDLYMDLKEIAVDNYGISDFSEAFVKFCDVNGNVDMLMEVFIKQYGDGFVKTHLNDVNPAYEVVFKCKEYYMMVSNEIVKRKIKKPADILKL